MGIYLLDKAYRHADSGTIHSGRVVVAATDDGDCKLPAAANASRILGIAMSSQTVAGRAVTVRKAGVATAVAAGAIAYGAPVNIAGTSGKVKAINEASGTKVQCVGFAETATNADGELVEVFVSIHERTA